MVIKNYIEHLVQIYIPPKVNTFERNFVRADGYTSIDMSIYLHAVYIYTSHGICVHDEIKLKMCSVFLS